MAKCIDEISYKSPVKQVTANGLRLRYLFKSVKNSQTIWEE